MRPSDRRPSPARVAGGRARAGVPSRPERPGIRARNPAGPDADGEHRAVRATLSSLALIVIALGVGLLLAAGLGAAVWAIASALHHAANN